MSDATAIFLMLGIFLAAMVSGAYLTKLANDRMDEILTGVVNGASFGTRHRTIMLYNQWLPMMSSMVGGALIAGLGYFEIAGLLSGAGALIAYVLVGWWGWAFFMNLFLGGSTLLNCLSILRQAEAD